MAKLTLWVRIGAAEAVPCNMVPVDGSGWRRWRVVLEDGRVVEPGEPCKIVGGLDADRAQLMCSGYVCA